MTVGRALPKGSRAGAAVLLVAMLSGVTAPPPAAAQQSPLVEQIVRMLEAELSEDVILAWLEGRPPASAPLSADELVALKQAGASDELMKRLLAQPPSEAAGPAAAEEGLSSVALPAPGRTGHAPPVSVPGGEAAIVTVHLSYLPQFDEREGGSAPPWDLYVYVDGLPVSYVPSARVDNRPETIEFERLVAAGEHTVRVAQERHVERGGSWHHETRFAPTPFQFELDAGRPARLEVEFHERLLDYQDPLVFKLTQGERILDTGRLGGDAERWPPLCADIEASVPAGKKPSRKQRQRLERCLEWEGLWAELPVPSRQEVLDAMAELDFRPRPKGS
jgi:hypothetical protein